MTAKVYCTMKDCKHRGRVCSTYVMKNGKPLYVCKLDLIIIYQPMDWDEEYYSLYGNKEARCNRYESTEDEAYEQERE